MKKVFIIHGFQGSPNGGWRPWLMAELEKHDVYACALPMPTPEAPVQEEWVSVIKGAVAGNDPETYLIGHSLGSTAILRYLETSGANIAGVVLASTPYEATREQIKSFYQTPFDFEKIQTACKQFAIIHGEDDPYVPFAHAEKFAAALNTKLFPIRNGGHLNGGSNCFELPEALNALIKMMK